MLQDSYETDKLFDSILSLTNQMDPVLAQIDQLLDDEALYQLIWFESLSGQFIMFVRCRLHKVLHAIVEGRISVLKRRHELDRCRDYGSQGFDKWVAWGVIAANLLVIGRKVASKA